MSKMSIADLWLHSIGEQLKVENLVCPMTIYSHFSPTSLSLSLSFSLISKNSSVQWD